MIKEINTETEYEAALERIDVLFDAVPETPEATELQHLVKIVQQYEAIHHPII